MYDAPTGYSDAVVSDNRTIDIFLSVGLGMDTTAAEHPSCLTRSQCDCQSVGIG